MSVITPGERVTPGSPPLTRRRPPRVSGGMLDPSQLWRAMLAALGKLNPLETPAISRSHLDDCHAYSRVGDRRFG